MFSHHRKYYMYSLCRIVSCHKLTVTSSKFSADCVIFPDNGIQRISSISTTRAWHTWTTFDKRPKCENRRGLPRTSAPLRSTAAQKLRVAFLESAVVKIFKIELVAPSGRILPLFQQRSITIYCGGKESNARNRKKKLLACRVFRSDFYFVFVHSCCGRQ
jgi:hypothetical protein